MRRSIFHRFDSRLVVFLALVSPLAAAGKVYLVLGSDTAIWEGMDVHHFDNYYPPGLYTDPSRNAAQVMDPAFRNQLVDSFGTPMKLTWWMMSGNIFRYATNTNIPSPNIMTLYLMRHNYGADIAQYGDELSLHYHTFVWSDLNGDGNYWWNQALSFTDSREDWRTTLANFLLEENVFPVSFRSGWHYMDNDWQAELNQWIPFSMHNDWPHVHTDTEEPTDNNYDWSHASAAFIPFQPAPDDYQSPGGDRGWNLRSVHFNRVRYLDLMDSLFIKAEAGEDQVACFWGHLPETDFLDNLVILDSLAHQAESEHPTVQFRYCSATEAMQRWMGSTDSLAPALNLEVQEFASSTRLTIAVNEPLFMEIPFISWKDRYEEAHVTTDIIALNDQSWQATLPQTANWIGKIGVAVTDAAGNLETGFYRFLPDDQYLDNRDGGYSEIAGSWTTSGEAAWGIDSRVCTVNPGDTATVQWQTDIPQTAVYGISTQFSIPAPMDSLVGILDNGTTVDTVNFSGDNDREWIWVSSLEGTSGQQFTIWLLYPNSTGSPVTVSADVLKISAYVRDRDISVQPGIMDLGEVSILDTVDLNLTLINSGIEALTVQEIRWGSTNESLLDSVLMLPPMSRQPVTLRHLFTAFGVIQDSLLIHSDDPRTPVLSLPVIGSAENYFTVVDNDDGESSYSEFGDWHTSNAQAYGPSSRYCYLQHGAFGGRAVFYETVSLAGIYDLFEIVPATVNASNAARYRIRLNGILIDSTTLDQNSGSGGWIHLGRYFLPAQVPIEVEVLDPGLSTAGTVLRADAMKFQLVEAMESPSDTSGPVLPDQIALYPAYPNPFNSQVILPLYLRRELPLEINIYNLQGKHVRRLHNGLLATGNHRLIWDGTTDSGQPAATGIYFIVLQAENFQDHQKVLYLK